MPVVKNSVDTLTVTRKDQKLTGTLASNSKKGADIVFCSAVAATTDESGKFDAAIRAVEEAEYGVEIKNSADKVLLAARFTHEDTDVPETAFGDFLAISVSTGRVSGRFTDKNNKAIQSVSAVVGNLKDNPITAKTDAKGKFTTNAEVEGGKQFFVKVTINPRAKNERLLLGAFISD